MKLSRGLTLIGFWLCCNLVCNASLNEKPNHKPNTYLSTNAQSKPGFNGDTISYIFQVKNISDKTQTIHLNIRKPRELACETILSEEKFILKPGTEQTAGISVIMNDLIPVGGYENAMLIAKNEKGEELACLKFSTTHAKAHPFLLTTNQLFKEVANKVEKCDWAKDNFNNMLKELDSFEFPEQKVITKPRPTKVWSSLNYVASDGEKAFKLAIAYRLTGEKRYYNKLIAFIQELTDPKNGYLSVGAATTNRI
ncbi:hypothetical protein [Saccharicrinis sp. 156]|uniref:hypothetical protein n=1 Tax=Saccharicrinis sp. 156 TaxID=3417574 RepID=UPI003D34C386